MADVRFKTVNLGLRFMWGSCGGAGKNTVLIKFSMDTGSLFDVWANLGRVMEEPDYFCFFSALICLKTQ